MSPYRTTDVGTFWRDDPDERSSPSSDVSFPEPESFNGTDMRPLPSQPRSRRGDIRRRIVERDCQELAAALRLFRATYGAEVLQRVIQEATS